MNFIHFCVQFYEVYSLTFGNVNTGYSLTYILLLYRCVLFTALEKHWFAKYYKLGEG